jgi:hypothetical protein
MESHDGMILTGENQRTQEKNLSQRHFVHHKSAWIDTCINPCLCVGKLMSNHLSHGTAMSGQAVSQKLTYISGAYSLHDHLVDEGSEEL